MLHIPPLKPLRSIPPTQRSAGLKIPPPELLPVFAPFVQPIGFVNDYDGMTSTYNIDIVVGFNDFLVSYTNIDPGDVQPLGGMASKAMLCLGVFVAH